METLLTMKIADISNQTEEIPLDQLSLEQIKNGLCLNCSTTLGIINSDNFEHTMNNAVPKNGDSIRSREKHTSNHKHKLSWDTSLKRNISNKYSADSIENSDKAKKMKKTTEEPNVKSASNIAVHSNKKYSIPKKLSDTKNKGNETRDSNKTHNSNETSKSNKTNSTHETSKSNKTSKNNDISAKNNENLQTVEENVKESSEKSNEIDIPRNENPKAAENIEIITISDKTTTLDDNTLNEMILTSQNYKDFIRDINDSTVMLFKSAKFVKSKRMLRRISNIFNSLITLLISEDIENDNESNEDTSLKSQSNDTNKTNETALDTNKINEIALNLDLMKQEMEDVDADDSATVVSEVVDTPETDTYITEGQINVSGTEMVQQEKQQQQQSQQQQSQQQQQPQQKTNNEYNYFEQYNAYLNQHKTSQTLVKEIRPPPPPSTTPSLQQNHLYNNQNSYSNQDNTKKNYRYPNKRSYNRQAPYLRLPLQMHQNQMSQLSQNHHTYAPYQQYVDQQNTQIQAQMQGMYQQNTPFH